MLVRLLRLLHGGDAGVAIEAVALGPDVGETTLHVNTANPTVSTRADAFIAATAQAQGWEGQRWDTALTVPGTTLDALIDRHGMPDFIKVDVEGFEAEVLGGLTRPPAALSFEIVTAARTAAQAALHEARRLGYVTFRLSLGESHQWAGPWMDAESMADALAALPDAANSGDVYAVKPGHPALDT
jgi:FkbM family methyltransferase